MSDTTGALIGVGILAVVGLFLLSRPKKKPILGMVGGQGYMPGKSTAVMAGIAALGGVASKTIDYFIARDADETKLAIAKVEADDSDEEPEEVH